MIDFMVMEAVAIKVSNEDREAAERDKRTDWKRDKEGFKRLRDAV